MSSLIAGANWNNGTNCRSRAQNANNSRVNANSNIAGQFTADTGQSYTPWLDVSTLVQNHQNTRRSRCGASSDSERHASHLKGQTMKRHGNLWDNITDLDNLRAAYRTARKGKSWQRTVQQFDRTAETSLLGLQRILRNKTFTTSKYKTKVIHEPKERLIYSLPFFPDRIVQHALMQVLEPIWEGLFIHESHACRKGKGIHSGSIKTMEYVRKHDYCLKCDISKFYPSIPHDTLFRIVKRKIKCPDTLALLENIIYSIGGGTNTPIGNYTSQWFGNLYMNELDRYVKQVLKIKAYVRYCDDFLLFHDDKRLLNDCAAKIKAFLADKLSLTMSKCSLFHVKQGVDFLGYRHFRHHILLRKSTTKRVIKRLAKLPGLVAKGMVSKESARSSIASTMGWMRWANCHNLAHRLNLEQMKEQYV